MMTLQVIDIPNLHDGSLTGLDFGEQFVTARMSDWTGKRYVLEMSGVERFHVGGVSSDNLIGWLEIVRGRRPNRRMLRRLFGTPDPQHVEVYEAEREDEDERADRVRSGDATLVVLHGNFTVFFVGFCASVILRRG